VFEGFGLVIVEALAAGLPVITTPHSMGPDVIEQGENGWIVPIRDSKALADCIGQLRSKTDSAYARMREKARQSALRFTWERYGDALGTLVRLF
jgi:glycosyltransferase involved in cell wall biosynthesis